MQIQMLKGMTFLTGCYGRHCSVPYLPVSPTFACFWNFKVINIVTLLSLWECIETALLVKRIPGFPFPKVGGLMLRELPTNNVWVLVQQVIICTFYYTNYRPSNTPWSSNSFISIHFMKKNFVNFLTNK